jgi:hypothetical protein
MWIAKWKVDDGRKNSRYREVMLRVNGEGKKV